MALANCVLTAGGGSTPLVLGWFVISPLQASMLSTSNSKKAPAVARVGKLVIACIFGHVLEFVNADARSDGILTGVNAGVIISPS
jgi:hypothetical protein